MRNISINHTKKKGIMTFSKIKAGFLILFLLLISGGLSSGLLGQSIPDLSTMNVDNLSDDQIVELMNRGASMGYSAEQMFQMAQMQGLSAGELSKLTERVNQVNSERVTKGRSYASGHVRGQMDWEKITPPARGPKQEEKPLEERIFGFSLFNNPSERLTFEPNLNLPTPKNYVVGPDDVLYIDIYGASEQYYESRVNAEGKVIINNFGPISVSGLTIEQAAERIRAKFAMVYKGLTSSPPNTFLEVSLGTVRTVKVNMVGEVKMAGTFTLSSLSTVFNALYVAGGVTTNGTLRNIKLYRGNKLVQVVDAYDFLIGGKSDMNLTLQDQDVIIVEPYTSRVEVKGEVKRPGIYELKGNETFADVLAFAGGFKETSYRDRISVTRNTDSERMVSDIFREQFELFTPKAGDVYQVGKILDRYTNRVQIKGAVFRPGSYALSEGLTVGELIKRAEGLTGDAYTGRAIITRTNENLTTETVSFDLSGLLSGTETDHVLQREDVVQVFSRYDLKEEYYVTITGEVNQAGDFAYSENLTVEDLIAKAGGLREAASESNIEITRRVKDQNSQDISDIVVLRINKDLSVSQSDGGKLLQPFDHVVVRRNPNYRIERFVELDGEVLYPGKYAIRNVNEKISDVISRAGGLTQFAYPKGATLIRRTEFFESEPELARQIRSLQGVKGNISASEGTPTESEQLLTGKLDEEVYQKASDLSASQDLSSLAKKERLEELGYASRLMSGGGIKETEIIGINLEELMANPGSKYDLILEEGDIISVPKQLQTVRLRGRILYPTTVRYENGKSLRYFVDRAGGFDSRARKGRTYVVYANGEVARTKSFVFIRNFPDVEPGSEIIVPVKPIKIPWKPGEILGITSGLATLALLVSQIDFTK